MAERPAAADTAPELVPFFESCSVGRLTIPRCVACGEYRWPPRPLCLLCGSSLFEWHEVASYGRVYSWTTTHRSPSVDFAGTVPFTIVVVTLESAANVRMVGRLVSPSPGVETDLSGLSAGARVRARFERLESPHVNVAWELVRPDTEG
ncbi:Zn-ribbon domain-containing OB-fold protein [Actinophytocola sp.]|uniref:Zn-ribbon domain-containing OB-fold protein n=1 Tax=Actinophytocola sp. TaxID=1872138 RepID=UPI003D6B7501